MSDTRNTDIKNTTKGKLPRLPFEDIKNEVLGENYELSLVFTGDKLSRKLNKKFRKKDRPTNILSFPLSDTTGEIFINYRLAQREAKKYNRKFSDFIGFLLIHGFMHLKGWQHSSKMERQEQAIRNKFGI